MATRLIALCCLLAVTPASVRTATAETRPQYVGKIIASLASAPATVDPLAATSYAELSLTSLLFDTLYRVDDAGAVTPHLAAALPVVSSDGLEARIALRAGVKWHNGKELKAADVLASLTRAAGSPQAEWILAPVKKLARDQDTIVIKLRRKAPELAQLLAVPQLGITPGGKAPAARAPVGSGPFLVKKLAADTRRVELYAFADHFAGRPYVDRLTLRWFTGADDEARAYEAGDADVSLRGAVAFAGHTPKYATDEVDGTATILVYLGFGRAHADLDADVDFRRAVSLAQNRGALKHLGAGERILPALLPESPDLGGATPSATEVAARRDEARAALAKAAKRNRALAAALDSGKNLPLALIVDNTRPDDAEAASRIVAALDELGLAVTFKAVEPAEFARRVAAGECDLYLGQLVAPMADPLGEWAAAFAAGGDKWPIAKLQAGALTRKDAAAAFAANQPIVPLVHRAGRAHHRTTLRGVGFDSLGRLEFADMFQLATGAN